MSPARSLLTIAAVLALTLIVAPQATARAPVVAAVGDLACPSDHPRINEDGTGADPLACRQLEVAKLIDEAGDYEAILALGDLIEPSPTLENFEGIFADSWGRHKNIMLPALGNHEYRVRGAAGYFDYFNGVGSREGPFGTRRQGWYAHRLGDWLLISLNSVCSRVRCDARSPQVRWLRETLRENHLARRTEQRRLAVREARISARRAGRPLPRVAMPEPPPERGTTCIAAFWHHPRFSSGVHGLNFDFGPMWRALHRFGADVVLNGHDHLYERFRSQNPAGAYDPDGITQFTVGTGGRSLFRFREQLLPSSVAQVEYEFGLLRLRLGSHAYRWNFVGTDGFVHDQGVRHCNDPLARMDPSSS